MLFFQKKELVNIVVIVTRYFGGILLGTGGLVRAYSDVTQKAIEEVENISIILGKEYEVKLNYSELEKLKYYAKLNDINIINTKFENEIICYLQIPNEKISSFIDNIEKKNLNILEYKEICEKYILS